MALHLAQDPQADALLSEDPLALLVGMLLDQQVPMERAFAGPARIAQRLDTARLDAAALVAVGPDRLAALMSAQPAVHRYPGSMARRVHALAGHLVERYDGDARALWATAPTGRELRRRLEALPGFGPQKAAIFVALLAKQLGVRPEGWREAAGPYGEPGVHRSVADVVDRDSLERVRETKRVAKAISRASAGTGEAATGETATGETATGETATGGSRRR